MRVAAGALLCVQAGLSFLTALFLFVASLLMPFVAKQDPHPSEMPPWVAVLIYGGLGLLIAGLGTVTLAGGVSAIRQRRWGLALAGAICAVIGSMACCNTMGFVTGTLALVFLSLPQVRAEFLPETPE